MFEKFKNDPFFQAQQEKKNGVKNYMGQEKKIYKDISEYIEAKEGQDYISEEEFITSHNIKEKYMMEYAEVMKYLDTLQLTPSQIAIGVTKDNILHKAVIDYSLLASTITSISGREAGKKFRYEYDLNKLVRIPENDRLSIYRQYQSLKQEEAKTAEFSDTFRRQEEMQMINTNQEQRLDEIRKGENNTSQALDNGLIKLMKSTEEHSASNDELEAMFNSCNASTDNTTKNR